MIEHGDHPFEGLSPELEIALRLVLQAKLDELLVPAQLAVVPRLLEDPGSREIPAIAQVDAAPIDVAPEVENDVVGRYDSKTVRQSLCHLALHIGQRLPGHPPIVGRAQRDRL